VQHFVVFSLRIVALIYPMRQKACRERNDKAVVDSSAKKVRRKQATLWRIVNPKPRGPYTSLGASKMYFPPDQLMTDQSVRCPAFPNSGLKQIIFIYFVSSHLISSSRMRVPVVPTSPSFTRRQSSRGSKGGA
jgi:hypothetical protein